MADENRLSGGGPPETDMGKLIELRPVFNQLRRLTMDAMRRGDKKSNLAYIEVRDILTAAPAVDAVEVVRCKDCKFYHKNTCPHWAYTETKPDDFCSYGERREG